MKSNQQWFSVDLKNKLKVPLKNWNINYNFVIIIANWWFQLTAVSLAHVLSLSTKLEQYNYTLNYRELQKKLNTFHPFLIFLVSFKQICFSKNFSPKTRLQESTSCGIRTIWSFSGNSPFFWSRPQPTWWKNSKNLSIKFLKLQ